MTPMVLLLGLPRPSSGWAATYWARSLMLQWVGRARDAPIQSARPPTVEFDCDEVWIETCETVLSVLLSITTGNTPHQFQTRVNQQDWLLARTAPPSVEAPVRYRPPDTLLAFLE